MERNCCTCVLRFIPVLITLVIIFVSFQSSTWYLHDNQLLHFVSCNTYQCEYDPYFHLHIFLCYSLCSFAKILKFVSQIKRAEAISSTSFFSTTYAFLFKFESVASWFLTTTLISLLLLAPNFSLFLDFYRFFPIFSVICAYAFLSSRESRCIIGGQGSVFPMQKTAATGF